MQTAPRSPPAVDQRAQRPEGVEVGAVVAGEQRLLDPIVGEQPPHGGPLVDPGGGADLQHLAPPVRLEARLPGRLGDLRAPARSAASSSAAPRQ